MSALSPQSVNAELAKPRAKPAKIKHGGFKGLYLYVKNGRGFWVHQFLEFGPTKANAAPHWHTRSKSLGSAADLTPAAAVRAVKSFDVARHDGDTGKPLPTARPVATADTFGPALQTYLDNHPEVPGPTQSLAAKYIPADFRAKALTAITAEDVARVLKSKDEKDKPLWTGPGPNRGNRLRLLMQHTFSAKAINPNPALWDKSKGAALPHCFTADETKRTATNNRPSMPYAELPAFFATLTDSIEDRAGKFVILTAARRKEALAMKWSEVDLQKRVWTVPAERMKMKRVHHVPLTQAMIDALGTEGEPDSYVFQNATGGPLSNSHAALDKEWLPNGYTLHGFRSTFSTWAAEKTDAKFEAREAALAHAKSNPESGKVDKIAGTYNRAEMFDDRVPLMAAWSAFATGR
jgi:integrase